MLSTKMTLKTLNTDTRFINTFPTPANDHVSGLLNEAGLQALFQLPLLKQRADQERSAQSAALQRQVKHNQEQAKTIQELVAYSHQLQQEADHSLASLNTTRAVLADQQASHEALCSTHTASLIALELSEADLLAAHASLALQHDLAAELAAHSAAEKVHLEQRISELRHDNTFLQVKLVGLEWEQLTSAVAYAEVADALEVEKAAHSFTYSEAERLNCEKSTLLAGLDVKQTLLNEAESTIESLTDKLMEERTISADLQTSNYLAEARIAELVAQLNEKDALLCEKDQEIKAKDAQLADTLEALERKTEEIQALVDTHAHDQEELSNALLATEIERDLLSESEFSLKKEIKSSAATLAETATELISKQRTLKQVKADAECHEAALIQQLQRECDAHEATREDLSVIQGRVASLTEERDTAQSELKDVRRKLRDSRRSSAHFDSSFEHARQENALLEEKIETMNNNYRLLETSKKSIEQAFVAKLRYCETLEKENATFKKMEGDMRTPTKLVVYGGKENMTSSAHSLTSSTLPNRQVDSDSSPSPLRNSTNATISGRLFRTTSLFGFKNVQDSITNACDVVPPPSSALSSPHQVLASSC